MCLFSLYLAVVRDAWQLPARMRGILAGVHVALIVLLTFNLLDEKWLERRGQLYKEDSPWTPPPGNMPRGEPPSSPGPHASQ